MSEYNSQFNFPHVVKLSNKLFITGATLMDMTQIAETIRKNCKALGISYESKAQGVTENDPLSQLLETMGDDD